VISAGRNQGYSYSRKGGDEPHHTSTSNVTATDKQNSYDYMEAGVVVENSTDPNFDDLMILENLENMVKRSNLSDLNCSVTINATGTNCGEDNTFFKSIGETISLSYKGRYYSTEYKTIDQPAPGGITRRLKYCVIECGEYGKITIYPSYAEVGFIEE
jgi:hypothetical protein